MHRYRYIYRHSRSLRANPGFRRPPHHRIHTEFRRFDIEQLFLSATLPVQQPRMLSLTTGYSLVARPYHISYRHLVV
jgi:hypothetical protein